MRLLPRRIPWIVPALALLVLVPPVTVSADIPPPDGWRSQPHDVVIDLGPYADVMRTSHSIAKGDTFGALSKTYLGTTTRWKEIAKANPGVDPDKLAVGTTLVIPAKVKALSPDRTEAAGGPRHRWDFHTFTPIWNALKPLPKDGRIRSAYHAGTLLVAVRHDKSAALAARIKKGPWSEVEPYLRSLFDPKSKEQRPDWVALGPRATSTTTKDADPVLRVEDVQRITRISGGVIGTERVQLRKLGAGGKVLSESEIVAQRNKGAMVFIFLGLIGFVLLVHITMRRRRAQQERLVTSPGATALLLGALLCQTAAPAAADVSIPGQRYTKTTVYLDFGPYAPKAQAKLEEAKRWTVFSAPSPSVKLTPCTHGEKVPVLHYGTQVFAVRHDQLADFKKRFAVRETGGYRLLRALAKEKPAWFATTNAVDAGRGTVRSSSPVYSVEKRLRITSLGNGVMGIETVSTTYFGKDGKKLTQAEVDAAGRMNLILLLLAGGGLAGLFVLLIRRRRQVTAPATA